MKKFAEKHVSQIGVAFYEEYENTLKGRERNMIEQEPCDCFRDVDDTLAPWTTVEETCKLVDAVEYRGRKRNFVFKCLKHGYQRAYTVYRFERELWSWSEKYRAQMRLERAKRLTPKPLPHGMSTNGSGQAA